jgi:hypothetical protein
LIRTTELEEKLPELIEKHVVVTVREEKRRREKIEMKYICQLLLLNSFSCEKKKEKRRKTHRKNISKLLCPPPSIQKGFALFSMGAARNSSSPFQNGTTSSFVPWIIKTVQFTEAIRSTLGKMSPGKVKRNGNATRKMDNMGLCSQKRKVKQGNTHNKRENNIRNKSRER